MDLFSDKRVTQIGFIVKDVEQSKKMFATLFGLPVPPTVITGPVEESHAELRGVPTKARAKQAFFHLKNLDFELMEPDEEPSTWREFLDTNGEGIHHLAVEVKDQLEVIRKMEGQGFNLIQRADYPGGRYAYLETTAQIGVILELLEFYDR